MEVLVTTGQEAVSEIPVRDLELLAYIGSFLRHWVRLAVLFVGSVRGRYDL